MVNDTMDWFCSQFTPDVIEEYNKKNKKWNIGINVYGGEPLIEYTHLQDIYNKYDPILKSTGGNPVWTIVTNMTLLDEIKLKWLINNKIKIACSIDGDQFSQDYGRVYADGSGSSKIVFENAKRLTKARPSVTCRSTVSPQICHNMFNSCKFCIEELGFSGCSAVLAAGCDWTDKDIDTVISETTKLTDYFIENIRKGKIFIYIILREH
jgi:uncharacterized protein